MVVLQDPVVILIYVLALALWSFFAPSFIEKVQRWRRRSDADTKPTSESAKPKPVQEPKPEHVCPKPTKRSTKDVVDEAHELWTRLRALLTILDDDIAAQESLRNSVEEIKSRVRIYMPTSSLAQAVYRSTEPKHQPSTADFVPGESSQRLDRPDPGSFPQVANPRPQPTRHNHNNHALPRPKDDCSEDYETQDERGKPTSSRTKGKRKAGWPQGHETVHV